MNQTDVRVTEYTQGTFIIDMIDPDEKASIWRSVTQSKLKEDTIRDQEALNAAVVRVLADFPLAAGGEYRRAQCRASLLNPDSVHADGYSGETAGTQHCPTQNCPTQKR